MLVTNIESTKQMLEIVEKPAYETVKTQSLGCGKAKFFQVTNHMLITHVNWVRWTSVAMLMYGVKVTYFD